MYTTPIKALSNQKFRDLREQYGDAVGLLTGDIIENRDGQILVMTTEVLRNMLLQTPSELWGVGCIIFDEIHYLADPERGTTWEESIIMCPTDIQLVCLSATVTNAPEIAEWISRTHAPSTWSPTSSAPCPSRSTISSTAQLNLVINAAGPAGRRLQRGRRDTQEAGARQSPWPMPRRADDAAGERTEPTPARDRGGAGARDLLPAIFFLFSPPRLRGRRRGVRHDAPASRAQPRDPGAHRRHPDELSGAPVARRPQLEQVQSWSTWRGAASASTTPACCPSSSSWSKSCSARP